MNDRPPEHINATERPAADAFDDALTEAEYNRLQIEAENATIRRRLLAQSENGWQAIAVQQLDRLNDNPHGQTMRDTILALVDARIGGSAETAVFDRPNTCNRTTYHRKWKKQPVFADVLEQVTALARTWKTRRALAAIEEAATLIDLSSPEATLAAVRRLHDHDGQVSLRAAFGLLDRSGLEAHRKAAAGEQTDDAASERARFRQRAEERRRQTAEAAGLLDEYDHAADN